MLEVHAILRFHHADIIEQEEIIKDLIHDDLHSVEHFKPFQGRGRAHTFQTAQNNPSVGDNFRLQVVIVLETQTGNKYKQL